MRRFLTIVTAMSLAITALHAQEPNIYASGLSANAVDNTNQEVSRVGQPPYGSFPL